MFNRTTFGIPAIARAVLRLGVLTTFYLGLTAILSSGRVLYAQNLTLEGQTGGFITPTAYILPSAKGHVFSLPAVGFHYIHAGNVIGDISTLNITEGIGNRVEFGYSRYVHANGNNPYYSPLWAFPGMNVVHGKVQVLPEEAGGHKWLPAIGSGFVVRSQDRFVTGAIDHKEYTNGDVYVAATKTALNIRPALLLNFGIKFTNSSLFGLGGQATRFQGRVFGGIGLPLPGPWHTVLVPAAGFTQQPYHVKNLPGARIPTTLDYAVRWTQRENAHFTYDIGVGQVAGRIMPGVNLNARSVFGTGLTYRF